jgi:hypothetical protein
MAPTFKPLKDFSDYGFLRLLVSAPTQRELVNNLLTHGVSTSIPEIRRRRGVILRHLGYLKPGTAPTAKDYQRIYQTIAADWRDEDLI